MKLNVFFAVRRHRCDKQYQKLMYTNKSSVKKQLSLLKASLLSPNSSVRLVSFVVHCRRLKARPMVESSEPFKNTKDKGHK